MSLRDALTIGKKIYKKVMIFKTTKFEVDRSKFHDHICCIPHVTLRSFNLPRTLWLTQHQLDHKGLLLDGAHKRCLEEGWPLVKCLQKFKLFKIYLVKCSLVDYMQSTWMKKMTSELPKCFFTDNQIKYYGGPT